MRVEFTIKIKKPDLHTRHPSLPMHRILLSLLALTSFARGAEIKLEGDFKGPLGLQLYSLRETFKADPAAAFDKTRDLGFKYVEVYAAIPLSPEKTREELAARGITPI